MKKLIALTAAAVMTSSAAMAIELTGSASVKHIDGGTTTGSAEMTATATSGASTFAATFDIDAGTFGGGTLTTQIGPVAVSGVIATGGAAAVTLSMDVLAGDINIALNDSGVATLTATVSGVAITHVIDGDTSVSASLAGMDVTASTDNTAGKKWSVSTTLNGVTISIKDNGETTASMGLAGNTVTITNGGSTTVAITRDLTSGASLTATYATAGTGTLTLEAGITF
jgi:hypothetical protein